ncbi:efflux ABC transporter, permease protein [Ostertagia ostertagi]
MAGMDVSNNYWGGDTWTYLLLSNNADLPAMERQIPGYLRKLNDPNASAVWKLRFLPLKDIYLKSSLIATSPITYVYVFILIGLFILALACFNYINLSTARASTRAKEVGVRKVMGSSAGKLRWQFILETAVFVTGAVIIALLLLKLGLPAFNQLAAENLSLKSLLNPGSIVSIIAGLVLISIMSGSYPAFILSSFRPSKVLKGDSTPGQGRNYLRKTLVVVQFTVSTVMIAATIIVYQQLHFIRTRDLGYQREQILTVDLRDAPANSKEQFTREVGKLSLIKAVSRAYSLPGSGILQGMKLVSEYVPKGSKDAGIRRLTLDDGYLKTFGIGLAEGRMLNAANPSDKSAFMINEAAKKYFQWKDINGKMTGYYTFQYKPDGSYEEVPVRGPVVGVIKDYNHADLSSVVEPMIISLNEGYESQTAIRIVPGSAEKAVQKMYAEKKLASAKCWVPPSALL